MSGISSGSQQDGVSNSTEPAGYTCTGAPNQPWACTKCGMSGGALWAYGYSLRCLTHTAAAGFTTASGNDWQNANGVTMVQAYAGGLDRDNGGV